MERTLAVMAIGIGFDTDPGFGAESQDRRGAPGYSVLTMSSLPRPSRAAFSACQLSVAHLTRIG